MRLSGVASADKEVQRTGTYVPIVFLVQLFPPFRDQYFSFTGHFVANPATNFTNNERDIRPKCKKEKHENTTVLNKTHSMRVHMLAELSSGIH